VALDNIQLDIVVTLQGSQNIRNVTQALQGMARGQNAVRQNAQAMVPINLSQIRTWDKMTLALGEVERKYDAVFRAGAHMSMMGQGLISSAERIAQTTMGIVNAYEGYDTMLRRGAVALNTNEEWQGKLDEAIQRTAQTVGLLKPEEVAEGYYIWGAAAGMVVDTQEELNTISQIVEETMIATAMAGGTLEGNLNGVFGVISQFNLPMEKASDVVQTLGLMTERTAAQFPDLINSLSYIGPLAESLGITFEDVTSILGLLADAGQKGSRAGRGLAMVIEGMSAPSGPAGKALDGLIQRTHGLSAAWTDVIFPEGEFVGMRDMLIEMARAAEDMTDAERGRFYATAFTNNATRALIPLIEDQIDLNREAAASGKELTSVLDQQKYATDGAGEFFETMREKALGSITAIKGRLEASFFPVLQQIATQIMVMAVPVMEWLGEIAIRFGEWLKANPELVEMAIRIAGITAAAMAAAGILFSLGGAIMYLIGNLGVFFQGIGRILGPFGILIGLFVALGVAVWNNVGGIRDAIDNFLDAVGDLVSAVVGDGTAFRQMWEDIWGVAREIAENVVTAIADFLNDLAGGLRELAKNEAAVGIIRQVVQWFMQFRGVLSALLASAAAMWAFGRAMAFFVSIVKVLSGYTAVKGIILGVIGAIKSAQTAIATIRGLSLAFTAFGLAVNVAFGPVLLVIGAIIAIAALLFLAWQTNFLGIRDIVLGVVEWFTGTALPAITGFFTSLIDNVVTTVENIIEWFGLLPGRIGEFFGMVWEAITTWIGEIVAAIGGFIETVTTAIGDFLEHLSENWSYYLGYIIGFIIGWIANIIAAVIQFGIDFISNVVDFLVKFPERFARFLGEAWTNITTWFSNLITNVGTWMGNMIASITDWISKAPGRFMEWLGQVWTDVSNWFSGFVTDAGDWTGDVVENIVNFFKELPGKAVDAIGGIVDEMREWFGRLPTRLMSILKSVGGAIVDGIWKGIQAAWDSFWQSVHGFFSGIVDGVKNALGIQSPSKVFAEIGEYMIQGLSVGIDNDDSARKSLEAYTRSLMGVADGTNLGFTSSLDGLAAEAAGLSVTADGQRTIRIEMDLTSSDGSYDDATLEQLKAALTGSDLVRALERMAEVG